MTSPRRAVYLDCDTGVDDALALTLLLHHDELDLVGIGTVSGNISAAEAAANTTALLALAGCDSIPVAVGAHDPIAGSYDGGAPHVHGANGVGDVVLEAGAVPVEESAAEMLVRLARAHEGGLEVVAIGPLTNLALALEIEPRLPELVARLTIMGGAVWAPGNITPVAEANIYNDAEAARAVLGAGFRVVLVPLDVTMQHEFSDAEVELFGAAPHPLPRAIGGMLTFYLGFYEAVSGVRRSPLHDPLAALVAGDPHLATEVREVALEVPLSGDDRGRTVVAASGPVVGVVVAAHPESADRVRAAVLGIGG